MPLMLLFFCHTSNTEMYKLGLNIIPGRLDACSVLMVFQRLLSLQRIGNFIGLNATKQASDNT